MRLKDKIAIVTGGASGIAKAIVCEFVKEGAKVIAVDVNEKELAILVQELGESTTAIPTDISRSWDVRKMISQVIDKYGQIDLIVNAAGIIRVGDLLECTEDDWDKVFNVNVKGIFLVSKYAVPHMTGGSSIINIGSAASVRGFAQRTAYNASKGAVALLTRSMAVDLATRKIRVNCLCPGPTKTEMAKKIISEQPEWEKMHSARILVGRLGEPQEIAKGAVFLASDEASFVNGTLLMVDGGITTW